MLPTALLVPVLVAAATWEVLPAPMDLAAARQAVASPDSARVWALVESSEYEAILHGDDLRQAAILVGRRALPVASPFAGGMRSCPACYNLHVHLYSDESVLSIRVDRCCGRMKTHLDGRSFRHGDFSTGSAAIDAFVEEVVMPRGAPGRPSYFRSSGATTEPGGPRAP